jgi:hypothetical protein
VTNLLLRSEEFQTTWSTVDASITSDIITAPNGTITADKLVENTVNTTHRISQLVTIASPYTLSCSFYAKAGERNRVGIWLRGASSVNRTQVTFNLSTGLTSDLFNTGLFSGGVASMIAVGNGWYRCSVSATCAAGETAAQVVLYLMNDTVTISNASYTGDGTSGIYLWGAQLEQSSTVGEYIPTTSAINSAPRFDHNPTTGESLGLLVEEQRTNLALRSEEFDNASWAKANVTVTANSIVAPNGTITADTLTDSNDVTAATHAVSWAPSFTSGLAYTLSFYAQAGTLSGAAFLFPASAFTSNIAGRFNISTGTVASFDSGVTASITNVGGGWFRCAATATATATASGSLQIRTATTSTSFYQGDGAGTIYLWGAQLEAGAFPTSYIPTTTATVTRSADVASISGSNFSSWYRQDEGTVFAECTGVPASSTIYNFHDGTAGNRIIAGYSSDVTIQWRVNNGGVDQWNSVQASAIASRAALRHILGYKADNFAGSANGGALQIDTSGTVPTTSSLAIGMNVSSVGQLNGTIRRLTYWPTRLPNSTLQAVTQ